MGSSFRTAVEHLADSDAAMFALADQPFVTTQRVPDACSTPTASRRRPSSASGTARSWRRRICSSGSSSPSSPQLQHGARPVLQRHVERTMVLQFPPDLLVDIDTPEDYELAKSRLSSRTVKAADRAAEEPALESAPNRQDLPQDRHRHFVRRFGAKREPDRAAHARRASRRPACSPAPPGRPAASRSVTRGPSTPM